MGPSKTQKPEIGKNLQAESRTPERVRATPASFRSSSFLWFPPLEDFSDLRFPHPAAEGKRPLRSRSPPIENRRPMPPPPSRQPARRYGVAKPRPMSSPVMANQSRRCESPPTPGKETGRGQPPPHRRAGSCHWPGGVGRRFELWGERHRSIPRWGRSENDR